MSTIRQRATLALLICAAVAEAQSRAYQGPRPPEQDKLYLLHADTLVPTEAVEAAEDRRKDGSAYTLSSASSSARTPLSEPIFLLSSKSLNPDKLALYRFEVKNGRREVFISPKPKSTARPRRHQVTRLAEGLYQVEVAEPLENGEYGFSPDGTNQVFGFQVY